MRIRRKRCYKMSRQINFGDYIYITFGSIRYKVPKFGVTLKTNEEIAEYAQKLKDMGARNVLVSMAGDGALLLDENGKTHVCGVCRGTVKNSVGAGDSMVAGFIAGSERGDYEYALKLGTAAGGATAFSDGLAERAFIDELLKQL